MGIFGPGTSGFRSVVHRASPARKGSLCMAQPRGTAPSLGSGQDSPLSVTTMVRADKHLLLFILKMTIRASLKASVFHAQLMTAVIQAFHLEARGSQATFILDRSSPTCVRQVWICSAQLNGFAWRAGSGVAQCHDAWADMPMTPPAMWQQPSLDH